MIHPEPITKAASRIDVGDHFLDPRPGLVGRWRTVEYIGISPGDRSRRLLHFSPQFTPIDVHENTELIVGFEEAPCCRKCGEPLTRDDGPGAPDHAPSCEAARERRTGSPDVA